MILHNMFTILKDEVGEISKDDPKWREYHLNYELKAKMCPCCVRRDLTHCVHQATYRRSKSGEGVARAPSEMRDHIRDELWGFLTCPPPSFGEARDPALANTAKMSADDRADLEAQMKLLSTMQQRATMGFLPATATVSSKAVA